MKRYAALLLLAAHAVFANISRTGNVVDDDGMPDLPQWAMFAIGAALAYYGFKRPNAPDRTMAFVIATALIVLAIV